MSRPLALLFFPQPATVIATTQRISRLVFIPGFPFARLRLHESVKAIVSVNVVCHDVAIAHHGWQRGKVRLQSSFRIVPVATASTTDAPTALRSSTVKVSSGSRLRSDLTVIVIFWLQTPGGKVRVPLAAV